MLYKINKLINDTKDESSEIYKKLVAIAGKLTDRRDYFLVDIREMESLVDPEKVDIKDNVGKMELDL